MKLGFTIPLLHSLEDIVPASEACLYNCIIRSLAQGQQQYSVGLSHCFPPMRGGKTRP